MVHQEREDQKRRRRNLPKRDVSVKQSTRQTRTPTTPGARAEGGADGATIQPRARTVRSTAAVASTNQYSKKETTSAGAPPQGEGTPLQRIRTRIKIGKRDKAEKATEVAEDPEEEEEAEG